MAPFKNENENEKPVKKPKRVRKLPPKDTDEYRMRRDKNNDSVKKSRDKARSRAHQTFDRVNRLKEENERLEQQVQILSKELSVLRDLFKMVHAGEASGSCSMGETGASDHKEDIHVKVDPDAVLQGAESLADAVLLEHSAKTEPGAAESWDSTLDGTAVNQEALARDHEYFSSMKGLKNCFDQ